MRSPTREHDLTDFHACIRQGDAASARKVADRLYGQGGAFSPLFVDDIVSSSEASALIFALAPYWPKSDVANRTQNAFTKALFFEHIHAVIPLLNIGYSADTLDANARNKCLDIIAVHIAKDNESMMNAFNQIFEGDEGDDRFKVFACALVAHYAKGEGAEFDILKRMHKTMPLPDLLFIQLQMADAVLKAYANRRTQDMDFIISDQIASLGILDWLNTEAIEEQIVVSDGDFFMTDQADHIKRQMKENYAFHVERMKSEYERREIQKRTAHTAGRGIPRRV